MTHKYRRILVGVDGSEISNKAFEEAVDIARRNDAELYIASIIQTDTAAMTDSYAFAQILEGQKEAYNKQVKFKIEYAESNGVKKITPVVRVGSPKREIAITIPEEFSIDLTVIGITGKGRFEKMLMGSVAQFTSIRSKTNVLLIH